MTTHNKDIALQTSPHYTDRRFREPQTIFGQASKSQCGHKHLSYDYSDRLWQWDYSKAEEATQMANDSGAVSKSCHWYEVYLSAYFGKAVVVEHILAGVNLSNGYPYAVFGYKDAPTQTIGQQAQQQEER